MTITEIAQKAGVSIGTVDRVIHNRGRVAPETAERINAVIAEYGYQPNPIARHLKLNRNFVIGVLLPNLESESGYWRQCYEGICEAEKELSPFSVYVALEEFDRSVKGSCLAAGKKLLSQNVDMIVMAPVMDEDCHRLLAEPNMVPYAFVDSPLPQTSPQAIVAQNPFRGGLIAGRIMQMLAPQTNKYMIFMTYTAAYNSRERSRGFNAYFLENGDAISDEFVYNGGSVQKDFDRALDEYFAQKPNIGGVFVVNDAVHYVGEYLKSRGLKDRIALIGYDIIPENRQALVAGKIDCLLAQRPQQQGYSVIQTLYRKQILQQQAENTEIPVDVFFKEHAMALD